MNEEYLWDRSGAPDPETARLERVLGQFRYVDPKPVRRSYARSWWVAAAAVLIVGVVSALLAFRRAPVTAWQMGNGDRLRAGQLIETGATGETTIESEATGEVRVDARSRLRLIASRENQQLFNLERGTIHALIWAPPGRFVVDTPSAKTVDLGCSYTLHVLDDGAGLLTVETGWVAFEWRKHESFIPAGAACITRPQHGPGTPYFQDAPEALTRALSRFDISGDSAALEAALQAARARDALSLWHLMARTEGTRRGEVFDRFASLVKLPPAVTREAILRGDGAASDAAWDALNLESTEWWREWKRPW